MRLKAFTRLGKKGEHPTQEKNLPKKGKKEFEKKKRGGALKREACVPFCEASPAQKEGLLKREGEQTSTGGTPREGTRADNR